MTGTKTPLGLGSSTDNTTDSNHQKKQTRLPELFHFSKRAWAGLIFLTGIAAVLSFTGIDFGLPHDSRPDEIPNIQVAFTLLKDLVGNGTNALNPKTFNYGSLYYYLLTGLYWVYFSIGQFSRQWINFEEFVMAYQMNPTAGHLIIRSLSAVAAIALTPLMFFTARSWTLSPEHFDCSKTKAAVPWFATILMVGCYLVNRNAHFGSPDTLMTLGILASLWRIWCYQQEPQNPKSMQWAGIAIGLATSIKIPAILMLIPLAIACLIPNWKKQEDFIDWKAAFNEFIKGIGWAAMAFILTSPWMLLDIPGVLKWFSYEGAFYGFTLPGLPVGWQFYPSFAIPNGIGFLTYTFSLLGILLLLLSFKNNYQSSQIPSPLEGEGRVGGSSLIHLANAQNITLVTSILVFTLFLGPNLRIMTRYALPLVPFLLLSASYTACWLFQKFQNALSVSNNESNKHSKLVSALPIIIMLVGLLWEPVTYTLQWDWLLLQGDTRQMASGWLMNHSQAQTAIATGPRLGQIRLPLNYGQLLLETGPNNLRPPEKPSIEPITQQTQLSNTYDPFILKQVGNIRYVVLYGGDLLFSTPSWELQRYFSQWQPVAHFSPLKPKTENLVSRPRSAQYDPLDAQFIPYVGFEDSAYTGPEIFIFDITQEPRVSNEIKNPANPE